MKHCIIYILSFILFFSCIRNESNIKSDLKYNQDILIGRMNKWNEFLANGQYDSLILDAHEFLDIAKRSEDTLSILYTYSCLAQSFLFIENRDSTEFYINKLEKYPLGKYNPSLASTFYNIKGINYLKDELNYAKALDAFKKGYSSIESSDDINNKITMLLNIVNIYYLRNDPNGLSYADKALSLINEHVTDFNKCQIYLKLAQMYFLTGDIIESTEYLKMAEVLIKKYDLKSLYSELYLSYASNLMKENEKAKVVEMLDKSLKYSRYSEPGIITYVYLLYGEYYENTHDYNKAILMYKKGLDISYNYDNIENRAKFLYRISDIHYKTGNKIEAGEYLRKYNQCLNTISNTQKEIEFNRLLMSYKEIEHENQIQEQELIILKSQKKQTLIIFISLIILIITLALIRMYTRQRKMYIKLAEQYYLFKQKVESQNISEGQKDTPVDSLKQQDIILFNKIEALMKNDKIYLNKDISIDLISEILNTNRTYVSRAINNISNMTFYSYLDSYRIKEATNIIENKTHDIIIKKLALDVGYNSVQVFYNAFKKETGCTPGTYISRIDEIKKQNHYM